MAENDKPVLIYSTFPSADEAERVGGALVDRGLAACVNIFPGMTAIYVWEGKRQRETETAMLIKTRDDAGRRAVVVEARKLHPYSNPALLCCRSRAVRSTSCAGSPSRRRAPAVSLSNCAATNAFHRRPSTSSGRWR